MNLTDRSRTKPQAPHKDTRLLSDILNNINIDDKKELEKNKYTLGNLDSMDQNISRLKTETSAFYTRDKNKNKKSDQM